MHSKIIFLDIDGVLCTEACALKPQHKDYGYPFNSNCVKAFNEILLATGAEIILTSDWRIGYDNDLNRLDEIFQFNGVFKSPIDLTPDFGKDRDKEIATYIFNHPEIKSFIILDDLPLKIHSLRFTQTSLSLALNEPGIIEKAIKTLNCDQGNILTCINCEKEFVLEKDQFACSAMCRAEIENLKESYDYTIKEEEIGAFLLNNRINS
jgi:hypothetical protein